MYLFIPNYSFSNPEYSAINAKIYTLHDTKCQKLLRNPLLYRLRPEIGPQLRLVPVQRYVILYRVVGDTVRIERVVHGARDLPALPVGNGGGEYGGDGY